MHHPAHDPGHVREDTIGLDGIHDHGIDHLLRWIEETLLDQAGARWGVAAPTWIDVAQVLDSRSDLVVPVFRATRLTGSEVLDAGGLLAVDAEAFVAVAVLAGLLAYATV